MCHTWVHASSLHASFFILLWTIFPCFCHKVHETHAKRKLSGRNEMTVVLASLPKCFTADSINFQFRVFLMRSRKSREKCRTTQTRKVSAERERERKSFKLKNYWKMTTMIICYCFTVSTYTQFTIFIFFYFLFLVGKA